MRYWSLALLLMLTASTATQSHVESTIDTRFESTDAGDSRGVGDIAGSGSPRLDVDTNLDNVIIAAVRELSLRDGFGRWRDWRGFDWAGYYPSTIDRTVLTLGVGIGGEARGDGVAFALRRVRF